MSARASTPLVRTQKKLIRTYRKGRTSLWLLALLVAAGQKNHVLRGCWD